MTEGVDPRKKEKREKKKPEENRKTHRQQGKDQKEDHERLHMRGLKVQKRRARPAASGTEIEGVRLTSNRDEKAPQRTSLPE